MLTLTNADDAEFNSQKSVITYVYVHSGSSARLEFQVALANLALDKSIDMYGPFKLVIIDEVLTANRSHQQLSDGKYHFIIRSDWTNRIVQENYYIRVPHAVWNGYQGYRQVMIHRDNLQVFNSIKTVEQLQHYSPGQGQHWLELLIYQDNDFRVVSALTLNNLYSMLALKRFDFLPLGINEIQSSLADARKQHKELVIVPNLLIHYPMHLYFQVSKKHPELAERLEYGLSKAIEDNSYQELTDEYFKVYSQIINKEDLTVIELQNKYDY